MQTIFLKEINEFFSSLTAYISMVLFLLIMGLFLWVFPDTSVLNYGYASLETLFYISPWVFMFLVPAITMRFIAEEKRSGTFELLATSPISGASIIMGKYLSGVLLVLFCLLPTLIYYFSIYQLGAEKGNIDTGAVIGSYIGLFLLGASFVSIGLFASSLSKNQVVAFLLAVFISFFCFAGFDAISHLAVFNSIGFFIAQMGINEHYLAISKGVLDTRDLLYFISFSGIFLLLSRLMLQSRNW